MTCEVEAQELKVKGSHLTAIIECKSDHEKIKKIAEEAKSNCPISVLLNCPITLDVEFTEGGLVSSYS